MVEVCCICLEGLDETAKELGACKHRFHQSCIVEHIMHEFMRTNDPSNCPREKVIERILNPSHVFHCPLCRGEIVASRNATFSIPDIGLTYKEQVGEQQLEIAYDFGPTVVKFVGLKN